MSDQPLTLAVLTAFHREFILPELRSLAEGQQRLLARFDDVDGRFDAVFHGLSRLEDEYHLIFAAVEGVEARLEAIDGHVVAIEGRTVAVEENGRTLAAAVHRLEERLSRVEQRLEERRDGDGVTLRAEVAELRARVSRLERQVRDREAPDKA